ncbi:MAG: sugar phosphate isomerase/epimerase, partial [Chloroflexia bacterium]|nr:sugar phosphate isomerase/epimerase [Chloroflexia bacterium]
VGVIHDAGNMVYEGHEQYRLGLEMLGPYLGHVHVKDARWRRDRNGWQAEAAPLGDGMVDLPRLFAALAHVGYDGWLGVEDFSTDRSLPDRLRRNLSRIRAALDEVAATRAAPPIA